MVGAGIAGLWTLRVLLDRGLDAVLLESEALGAGQSIQAQGIIHGGGKYALRRVADLASVQSIAQMPDRWLTHAAGQASPDLSAALVLSDHCCLWLPRSARWRAWLDRWGVMPMLRHGNLLQTKPTRLDRPHWPKALAASARAVYQMAEPVFATATVLEALAAPVTDRVLHVESEMTPVIEASGRWGGLQVRPHGAREAVTLRAEHYVLTAGAGNEGFLRGTQAQMQRRPLRMLLLKGRLPELYGHCILGGRTRLTVTSSYPEGEVRVWQLGGEIAEQLASTTDEAKLESRLRRDLADCLPGLDLSDGSWASYSATRAEAATSDARRPSGVDVRAIAPNTVAAWPTKWALAPLLAEELSERVGPASERLDGTWRQAFPTPPVARYPWEGVRWNSVH